MDVHLFFEAAVIALPVGLLIGLTCMGGGSILTPLLILYFHLPPLVALGTGLD